MNLFTEAPPAPRAIPKREADALVSAALLEATRQAAAASTELLAILRGGGLVNGVLEATTRPLDDAGELHLSWRVPAGSAAVTNRSDAPVVVSNAALGSTSGRGTTEIPAGGSAVVYLASTDLTVTGSPGGVVAVTAFTGVMPPAWATPGAGGGIVVGQPTAATAALSSVADSTTSAVLLPANPDRKGFAVYNESAANLFIAFAATASATAYTIKLPAGGYYEAPTTAVYLGDVAGVWDADSTGSARITELS